MRRRMMLVAAATLAGSVALVPRTAAAEGLFDFLFGGAKQQQQKAPAQANFFADPLGLNQQAAPQPRVAGSGPAFCVRSCDGGFFPLNFSARHGNLDQLTELCKALCPNAEVAVYTRNPAHDVSTALSIDGQPYKDLPNALKFVKSVEPNCGCKAPNQSWVEALAHAEEVLNQMGGASDSDTTVTEQQSQALSQPLPATAKDKTRGKTVDAKTAAPQGLVIPAAQPGATAFKPPKSAPRYGAMDGETREMTAPDGTTRRVRIVGPIF